MHFVKRCGESILAFECGMVGRAGLALPYKKTKKGTFHPSFSVVHLQKRGGAVIQCLPARTISSKKPGRVTRRRFGISGKITMLLLWRQHYGSAIITPSLRRSPREHSSSPGAAYLVSILVARFVPASCASFTVMRLT